MGSTRMAEVTYVHILLEKELSYMASTNCREAGKSSLAGTQEGNYRYCS